MKKRISNELARAIGLKLMSKDDNVYHNKQHVLDVEQFTSEIFDELQDKYQLSDLIKKCIKTAAILHDVCHPAGYSNNNIHELVVKSINIQSDHMETKHSKISEFILHKTNSFLSLGKELQEYYIQFIIKLILSTDLNTYEKKQEEQEELKLAILILRCADLSNLTKSLDDHLLSTNRLNNELGITISPQNNIEFIIKYVLPIFTQLDFYCKSKKSNDWINNINHKIEYWNNINTN
jgi:HD superfamily phosphohydrolase